MCYLTFCCRTMFSHKNKQRRLMIVRDTTFYPKSLILASSKRLLRYIFVSSNLNKERSSTHSKRRCPPFDQEQFIKQKLQSCKMYLSILINISNRVILKGEKMSSFELAYSLKRVIFLQVLKLQFSLNRRCRTN